MGYKLYFNKAVSKNGGERTDLRQPSKMIYLQSPKKVRKYVV